MSILQAIILGIIEGITEFLPISSTGHLTLATHIMKIQQTDFVKTFTIVIQLGAIFAVIFVYFERFLRDFQVWKRILIAFIPTGILGFLLYKLIKSYLIGNDLVVVISLIIGGLLLIFADNYAGRFAKINDITSLDLRRAFAIGVFQSIAMIPGVSRSGATIIGGMLMGLSRKSAAEFSFILAVPTMLMASTYDIYKSFHILTFHDIHLLVIGFLSSFISALIVVRYLLNFLSKNSFFVFGVYRIILGFVYAFFFLGK